MSSTRPDLGKLRIDRTQSGASEGQRRALIWVIALALLAALFIAVLLLYVRGGGGTDAVLGGALGCLIALPINGLVTSTTNWASFSEVAFAFRVTPALLLNGMIFAVVMGIVGGLMPARAAAKQHVVDALRQA
ncbi:MAG TPA: ABC transporter permease [Gemmatimonadales bacterium]|nr:ABC transporter permease [Gemmatimonadales bacterium]